MGDDLIDVRDLIAKYSNEEHARRANKYFHRRSELDRVYQAVFEPRNR